MDANTNPLGESLVQYIPQSTAFAFTIASVAARRPAYQSEPV